MSATRTVFVPVTLPSSSVTSTVFCVKALSGSVISTLSALLLSASTSEAAIQPNTARSTLAQRMNAAYIMPPMHPMRPSRREPDGHIRTLRLARGPARPRPAAARLFSFSVPAPAFFRAAPVPDGTHRLFLRRLRSSLPPGPSAFQALSCGGLRRFRRGRDTGRLYRASSAGGGVGAMCRPMWFPLRAGSFLRQT